MTRRKIVGKPEKFEDWEDISIGISNPRFCPKCWDSGTYTIDDAGVVGRRRIVECACGGNPLHMSPGQRRKVMSIEFRRGQTDRAAENCDHTQQYLRVEREDTDSVTGNLLQNLARVRMAVQQRDFQEAEELLSRLWGKTKEFTTLVHLKGEDI